MPDETSWGERINESRQMRHVIVATRHGKICNIYHQKLASWQFAQLEAFVVSSKIEYSKGSSPEYSPWTKESHGMVRMVMMMAVWWGMSQPH